MATDTSAPRRQARPPVKPAELEVWLGLFRIRDAVYDRLDRQLKRGHGLSIGAYAVLASLDWAEGERMRMSRLAESVSLSPSRVTRLAEEMIDDGLVARERCPADGRSFWVSLTRAGRRQFDEALPTHDAVLREALLDHFDAGELEQLHEFWLRLMPQSAFR